MLIYCVCFRSGEVDKASLDTVNIFTGVEKLFTFCLHSHMEKFMHNHTVQSTK